MGAPRNWEPIKAAYVAGATAEELATKFKVPLATVESTASRGKWGKARAEFASRLQAAIPEKLADEMVYQATDIARQNLQDLDKFRLELVALVPAIRKKGGPVSPAGWVDAYRKLMDSQRLALGLPTNNDPPKGGSNRDDTPLPPVVTAHPDAAPAAVLILPGKSTDWAQLADARAGGLDAEPGGASSVPGVPG